MQEKNLGELVDAEARALLQATQQGVAKQYVPCFDIWTVTSRQRE